MQYHNENQMRLGYVIIYVPDVAATVAFYEKAFGLSGRFVPETTEYAEMETGTTALAFVSEAKAAESCPEFRLNRLGETPGGSEIGFVTDDVAAAFATAVAAGATAVMTPRTKPWGQIVSYVRDLNGCLVEICSPIHD
jgi:catechol 2,3-dioxygenase-like lactoylglutathione lyase family enzyme